MKKLLTIIISLSMVVCALSACVKGPESSSVPDPIPEENNRNMEYEDPGIDPELANRELNDGDEITYAPEKEAILGAMRMAVNDLWDKGDFESVDKFKGDFRSPIPPEGMEKPDLKSIDDIKVIYSAKDGEAYVGYYRFSFNGSEWTMVAEYKMEKGSFSIPGTVSFVNKAI